MDRDRQVDRAHHIAYRYGARWNFDVYVWFNRGDMRGSYTRMADGLVNHKALMTR